MSRIWKPGLPLRAHRIRRNARGDERSRRYASDRFEPSRESVLSTALGRQFMEIGANVAAAPISDPLRIMAALPKDQLCRCGSPQRVTER